MWFENVSVIIPALRETEPFLKTIRIILDTCERNDLKEFIVVVSQKATSEACMKYVRQGKALAETAGVSYRILYQKRPYLGGALIDGFEAAQGSHIAIETADLNTAPDNLVKMITLAKQYPKDIISCSRWLKGGGFIKYSKAKKIWNYCSQKFMQVLFLTNVTDFTWGTHLAPAVIYKTANFQEMKHPIAIEELVIPLRQRVHIREIPGVCYLPENDETVNPFWANLLYLRPAFRWRFARKSRLLRKDVNFHEQMNPQEAGGKY